MLKSIDKRTQGLHEPADSTFRQEMQSEQSLLLSKLQYFYKVSHNLWYENSRGFSSLCTQPNVNFIVNFIQV